ncbi:MAG: metal-sulfur cluster assembly factor [Candidatus Micrarchaeia archaeon]|jgi:metal-sulfur cluster biosynthetic enzyme
MKKINKEEIIKKLKECADPEIGINVVDLGLIYKVSINNNEVVIDMTLTSPFCPLAFMITNCVEEKVKEIEGVKNVKINIVFEPPWKPEMMSKEARKKLGL